MSNERIENILVKHIAATDAKRAAAERLATEEAEAIAKRERAREQWPLVEKLWLSVIDDLSSQFERAGLGLSYEVRPSSAAHLLTSSNVKLLVDGK